MEGHTLKRMRFAFALMLALSLFLTACSGSKSDPAPNNTSSNTTGGETAAPANQGPKGTLKYYLTDKPTTFDPAMVTDVSTNQILQNVFSGLVTFDTKGGVIPDLAEKFDVSADGLTYTFTLKADAKFSDGTPVTAADFKRSILRNFHPGVGSPTGVSYLDDIAGAQKFMAAKDELDAQLKDNKISEADHTKKVMEAFEALKNDPSITVKDDKTLVLVIDKPKPFFVMKLTYPTGFVVGKSFPDDAPLGAAPENVAKAIGAGPFTMDSYTEGSMVVLKANANYAGEKAKVATVEMPVISSPQARLAAYRAGQIDVNEVAGADYPTLKADPELSKHLLEWAGARVNYLALNQIVLEAAKNKDFRLAVAHAINKEQLVKVVWNDTHLPAYGVLPDTISGANGAKIQKVEYNVDKAKDYLKKSGYEGLEFTITYRAQDEVTQRLAEFIQSQLTTNLGLKVNIEPMEWSALLAASRQKTELESFYLGWSADYPDPQNFLSLLLHSKAPYNRYGYANPEFDAMVEKADVMPNGPERMAEYAKAEQFAISDGAWTPLTYPKNIFLIRPTVKGFSYNSMGVLPLNTVTVE